MPARHERLSGFQRPRRRVAVGLSMAQHKAVTKQIRNRYRRARKKDKSLMLDELCKLTGWTRRHARRSLRQPVPTTPTRIPRPKTYDEG
jgi:hypothetical protein